MASASVRRNVAAVEAVPSDVEQAALRSPPELLVRVQRVRRARPAGPAARRRGWARRPPSGSPSAPTAVVTNGQAGGDRVQELELDPGAERIGLTWTRVRSEPLGRVVDVADDVDALAVERLDRRRGVRADDVQTQLRVALPEDRHHLVHEVEQRVLVRRARLRRGSRRRRAGPAARGSPAGFAPSRSSSGGRRSACSGATWPMNSASSCETAKTTADSWSAPSSTWREAVASALTRATLRRVAQEADHPLEPAEGERLRVERAQRLRLGAPQQLVEARDVRAAADDRRPSSGTSGSRTTCPSRPEARRPRSRARAAAPRSAPPPGRRRPRA